LKTVAFQTALSAMLVLIAAFAPPARGAMIALPLGSTPAYRLLEQKDIALIGAGPVAGSLIIQAKNIPLGFAFSHGILLMRGTSLFCSKEDRR
jgi:hypothetical protein